MADLSITAASVVCNDSGTNQFIHATAGGTITQGMAVYLDSSDSNSVKAAQANAATTDAVVGIALNAASDGQPVTYLADGNINLGATLTVGTVYALSAAAAGGIAPEIDLVATNYVTIIGTASTASNLILDIAVTSAQHP